MHVESEQRRRAPRIRRPATGGFFTRSKDVRRAALADRRPEASSDVAICRKTCFSERQIGATVGCLHPRKHRIVLLIESSVFLGDAPQKLLLAGLVGPSVVALKVTQEIVKRVGHRDPYG